MLTDEDKHWILEQKQEVLDRLEHIETKLLTEFFKWASPHEERLRSHSAVLRAFDVDLEWLRDRAKKLEDERRSA